MPPARFTLLATIALALCLAGCGGRTRSAAGRSTLGVALSEYAIAPASITAEPGLLTFVVHNYGQRTHDLVVTLGGTTVGSTPPLAPGQKARLTVALVPGRYVIASTIRNDQALGAYGSLVVR